MLFLPVNQGKLLNFLEHLWVISQTGAKLFQNPEQKWQQKHGANSVALRPCFLYFLMHFFVASEGIWRKQQKQQKLNNKPALFRRGHCGHRRATPSEKVTWSQLLCFLGETSQFM